MRRPDPRIAARIDAALGGARTVLNVGAGTGSYEPRDREVTAVEPSAEMIAQRPPGSAPVVQASAEELPFGDHSFDASLAVLTVHHWADLGAGLAELQRVSRERIVIVTFDPEALTDLWIPRDYFPEMLTLKRRAGATSATLAARLAGATVEPIPVPRDCTDLFFAALWARPEKLFDEEVLRPMWVWQSISEEARREGRERLRADLESGAWERSHGHLRALPALDVGLRLLSVPCTGGNKRLSPGTVSAMNSERAKELLANERAQVEREIASIEGEGTEESDERREPGDMDSEGLYQDEFDAGRLEDLRGRLAAVERAEERLAAGTYGLSIRSGEPIPDERLEAVPTAELTVAESEPGAA